MNSRPLLDYLAYPHEGPEAASEAGSTPRAIEADMTATALDTRLEALEAMLRAGPASQASRSDDATLAARVGSILGRKIAEPAATDVRQTAYAEPAALRMVIDPPPTAPAPPASAIDQEFLKFTEAVYLIGQAAKRFIEQPQSGSTAAAPAVVSQPPGRSPAPSASEIDALSAVLRETVSAFRSVADDLAVSAGEIRAYATREERPLPSRRPSRLRHHDEEDDVLELRESVAELQERLDLLMRSRRRARY